jgi:phosphoribosylformylglycinamidine synthase
MEEKETKKINYQDLGLKEEEYQKILKLHGRTPNFLELSMFAVMWSEHCAYKHSKSVLKYFPTSAPWVIQGPGENAGVIDIGDGYLVAFKMESHNHPSAIEPFQGAATGVGGIVRDILSMGARPIALLDPLRFGDLNLPRTKYLFEHVVSGIAFYGNCIGVPTVGGDIFFDPSFNSNPLVNVMCVGLLKDKKPVKSAARGVGNIVLLIGSKTGRDGIHGATFASEELSEKSEEKRPSVQVGDPFTEKLLIEACLELVDKNLVVALQDLGAAGLTSSTSEMATKGGVGIDLDVSKVPVREEGMEPYEIMLSESQERMLAIVEPKKLEEAIAVCQKWELNAAPIGKVTETGKIRVFNGNELIGEVVARHLTEESPVYQPPKQRPSYITNERVNYTLSENEITEALLKLFSSPHFASKRWVYEQYDHMVQTNTVLLPGHDAAILKIKGTKKAIALTVDGNPRYVYLNPYEGGWLTIAEAIRNLAVTGARALAFTDCLNFGNPEDPEIFYQFEEAVRGMADAMRFFQVPVVSGNVSFYNEAPEGAIKPSPIVGAVGVIDDVSRMVPSAFNEEGAVILLLGRTQNDFGGSELQYLLEGRIYGRPPQLDRQIEKNLHSLLLELAKQRILLSAHDLSEGGLAVALGEAAAGAIGFELSIPEDTDPTAFLFSESPSRALITVSVENVTLVRELCSRYNIPVTIIGETGGKMAVFDRFLKLDLQDFREKFENTLGGLIEY